MENEINVIFSNGSSATDIRQGGLGNCFLLSAMSVIAHSRPDLLQEMFHPDCREVREDGLYSLLLYRNKRPVIVTIDDKFVVDGQGHHAFVRLITH